MIDQFHVGTCLSGGMTHTARNNSRITIIMDCETYTLAPSVIADKARQLHSVGLHAQALALLQRNCVEARVYATYVEMSIPRPEKKPNKSHWKKGQSPRKGVKKTDED